VKSLSESPLRNILHYALMFKGGCAKIIRVSGE
jgi:hypothetical protein